MVGVFAWILALSLASQFVGGAETTSLGRAVNRKLAELRDHLRLMKEEKLEGEEGLGKGEELKGQERFDGRGELEGKKGSLADEGLEGQKKLITEEGLGNWDGPSGKTGEASEEVALEDLESLLRDAEDHSSPPVLVDPVKFGCFIGEDVLIFRSQLIELYRHGHRIFSKAHDFTPETRFFSFEFEPNQRRVAAIDLKNQKVSQFWVSRSRIEMRDFAASAFGGPWRAIFWAQKSVLVERGDGEALVASAGFDLLRLKGTFPLNRDRPVLLFRIQSANYLITRKALFILSGEAMTPLSILAFARPVTQAASFAIQGVTFFAVLDRLGSLQVFRHSRSLEFSPILTIDVSQGSESCRVKILASAEILRSCRRNFTVESISNIINGSPRRIKIERLGPKHRVLDVSFEVGGDSVLSFDPRVDFLLSSNNPRMKPREIVQSVPVDGRKGFAILMTAVLLGIGTFVFFRRKVANAIPRGKSKDQMKKIQLQQKIQQMNSLLEALKEAKKETSLIQPEPENEPEEQNPEENNEEEVDSDQETRNSLTPSGKPYATPPKIASVNQPRSIPEENESEDPEEDPEEELENQDDQEDLLDLIPDQIGD